jgi:hypothetical protein
LEFVKILIFITVDIFKHNAKKIRKLNEMLFPEDNTVTAILNSNTSAVGLL